MNTFEPKTNPSWTTFSTFSHFLNGEFRSSRFGARRGRRRREELGREISGRGIISISLFPYISAAYANFHSSSATHQWRRGRKKKRGKLEFYSCAAAARSKRRRGRNLFHPEYYVLLRRPESHFFLFSLIVFFRFCPFPLASVGQSGGGGYREALTSYCLAPPLSSPFLLLLFLRGYLPLFSPPHTLSRTRGILNLGKGQLGVYTSSSVQSFLPHSSRLTWAKKGFFAIPSIPPGRFWLGSSVQLDACAKKA